MRDDGDFRESALEDAGARRTDKLLINNDFSGFLVYSGTLGFLLTNQTQYYRSP